jgi:hypothetical protein
MRNNYSIALDDPKTCGELRYLEQKSCPRLRKYRLLLAMTLGGGAKAGAGIKIGFAKLIMGYAAYAGLNKIEKMAQIPHLGLYLDIALAAFTLTLVAPEIATRVDAYKNRQTSDAIYMDLENSVRSGKLEVHRAAKVKTIFGKILANQKGEVGGEPEGYYFWDKGIDSKHLIHPDGGRYLAFGQQLMDLPAMKPTPYISHRDLERLAKITEANDMPKTSENMAESHAILNEAFHYMTEKSGPVVWLLLATSLLNPKIRKYQEAIREGIAVGDIDVYAKTENGKTKYSMRNLRDNSGVVDGEESNQTSNLGVVELGGRKSLFSDRRLQYLGKLHKTRVARTYLEHAA